MDEEKRYHLVVLFTNGQTRSFTLYGPEAPRFRAAVAANESFICNSLDNDGTTMGINGRNVCHFELWEMHVN